jgi:hypothetical protein
MYVGAYNGLGDVALVSKTRKADRILVGKPRETGAWKTEKKLKDIALKFTI